MNPGKILCWNIWLFNSNQLLEIKNEIKKEDTDNFGILIIPKKAGVFGKKRKMVRVIDTIFIKGLQNYDKYTTLNPVELNFNSNYINEKIEYYKQYTFMFTLKNILFSANFTNDTESIFVICHNLNSTKKALINNKRYDILGQINLNEIKNWNSIRGESLCVNANLTDSHYLEKADHLTFSFKTNSPRELLEFSCELLNDKSKKKKKNRRWKW